MLASRWRPCASILSNTTGVKVGHSFCLSPLCWCWHKGPLNSDTQDGAWRQQIQQGWVQTLLQHSHRRFFHVHLDDSNDKQDEPHLPPNDPPMQQVDPQRVEQILALLPSAQQSTQDTPNQPQQQTFSVRDTPVWLVSTGIYDFVQDSTKAGLPPQELARLIPTSVARTGSLIHVTQNWLSELTVPLVKQSCLLRCRIVSPFP